MKLDSRRIGAGVLCTLLAIAGVVQADFVDDWARESDILAAKISPKGDYIAVLKEVDGKRTLANFSYPEMKLSSVMSFPGRNEVGLYWWINDERLLASIWLDFDRSETQQSHGELFAMNADGKKAKHLFGYRAGAAEPQARRTQQVRNERAFADLMDRLEDRPKEILVSISDWSRGYESATSAARLNVYTGKVSGRIRAPTSNAVLIADRDGQVRFSFSISDDQESVFHIRDPQTRKWREFSRTPYGESSISPIEMAEDGRIYVEYSENDGPTGVYLLDPKTQEREAVYQHELVDAGLRLDRNSDAYGVYVMPDRLQFIPIDKKHPNSRLLKTMQKLFPEAAPYIASYTDDFKKIIVGLEQPNKTPEFYLYDADAKKLELLFDSRPWLDDSKLGDMRPIQVTARDGVQLHGYLTVPAGAQAKNLPLLVVPHGGPHGPRDEWGFDWFMGILPASGYATLQINYRGSGGYGMKFERMGHREWGNKMQDDLTDATQWAIDEGIADVNRLCIVGWSYGGYAALMGVIREPDLYKCAVGGAGVYDQDIQYTNSDYAENTRWGSKYVDQVIGPTAQDRRLASPVHYVDQIKAPILLVHGKEDRRVPVEQVSALLKAMKAAGKPKPEVLLLPREQHSPANPKNIETMWRRILGFLEKHIGPGVAVASAQSAAR